MVMTKKSKPNCNFSAGVANVLAMKRIYSRRLPRRCRGSLHIGKQKVSNLTWNGVIALKAIMVMFDSLNRNYLPCYGCTNVVAPNFERLAERTACFENSYVGSLPCIPARRELHTGRYNFLHRSWGPLEPFDDSMPQILGENGIYSHLVSDHYHYWSDGGATYHPRYTSWEISRGQEGDAWKGIVRNSQVCLDGMPEALKKMAKRNHGRNRDHQDAVNREYMNTEKMMSQTKTFANGLEFIKNNYGEDNWFLQIESFDPHEPFFASKRFRDMYPDPDYVGPEFDWPPYGPVKEDELKAEHARKRYRALVSMCDYSLGLVLDAMDRYDMWKDTMLIVNTDHGYLLGEHGWWAKNFMPAYNEIARTPLFIWDPRCGIQGERRSALVQTIDLAPTLLDFFGVDIPKDMEGKSLKETVATDKPIREYALFGYFGKQVNITDGEYVYMREPAIADAPIFEYTLMPMGILGLMIPEELDEAVLSEPMPFTKGCSVLKLPQRSGMPKMGNSRSMLFNVKRDPKQAVELDDEEVIIRMSNAMAELMRKNNAPAEQFYRMGLPLEGAYTREFHNNYLSR